MNKRVNPLAIVLLLSAAFFVFLMLLSAGLFFWKSRTGLPSGSASIVFGGGDRGIGVIEVRGVILSSKQILEDLKDFERDEQIRAVLVRLDSPGGAVAPSQEIYSALKRLDKSKPVVASMSSVAASGAYYIACGARKIFANEGTLTGSIGVIMEFVNLEELYKWAKIKRYAIKSGQYKAMGSTYAEMTREERDLLQRLIEDVMGQFRKVVGDSRGLPQEKLTTLADGRIFSGKQARELKLVDETGTFEDATDAAAKLAGIKGEPNLIYPERDKYKWVEMFLSGDDDAEESRSRIGRSPLAGLLKLLGQESRELALQPGIYWLWNGYAAAE